MTQLYLIRHAEAMAAIKGCIGDGGRSPLGMTQSGRVRDRRAATKESEADVLIASTGGAAGSGSTEKVTGSQAFGWVLQMVWTKPARIPPCMTCDWMKSCEGWL